MLFRSGAQIQPLAGELRSHMPCGAGGQKKGWEGGDLWEGIMMYWPEVWGRCSGKGAQAGIVEGGARVVWLHRLPGCFLGEVVCVRRGSSCKDEEMAMNPVLPKIQNYRGSKA